MNDVLAGTWKTEEIWWGVKEGAIDLVSVSDKVSAATKTKLDDVKKGLKDGSFVIWKGPLKNQADKEVLKAGEQFDVKALRGIDFYVKGVEGKLPTAK